MSRILAIACLCACWLVLPAASHAQQPTRVYYFVDEQGVPHFSNVPADPRYRAYSGNESLAAQTPPPSAPPSAAPPALPTAAPPPLPAPPPVGGVEPLPPDEEEYQSDDR